MVTPSISPSSSLSDATWTPMVASSDIVASWPSPPSSAAAPGSPSSSRSASGTRPSSRGLGSFRPRRRQNWANTRS